MEEVFATFFKENWMDYLPVEIRESVIHDILSKKNATEVVRPHIAIDFILRYNPEKREEFMKALAQYLTIRDEKNLFPERG